MTTMTAPVIATHQQTLRTRSARGQNDLKKVQKHAAWKEDAAICIHAIALARLSRKEAAARLGLTESGLAAQLSGPERPQSELFRADDLLRGPYLIAQAMRHPELFDVVTTISVRGIR